MTHRDSGESELPLSNARPLAEDVRGELEFHIQQRAAELEERGMTRDRALAEARELFGDREAIEAECTTIERRRRSSARRALGMREIRQDLLVGFRLLRKAPGVSIAAVLTLAIGIGANAAVFSLVNQTLLKPLPYNDADRLVTVAEEHEKGWGNIPWPTFQDFQKGARSFSAMTSFGASHTTVLGLSQPLRVQGARVSHGFFDTFQLKPEKGRFPLPEEHAVGAPAVVVVSHEFWRDHLGAPASLQGVRITLDESYDVIGVMPPGFAFPEDAQLWTPLERRSQGTSRTAHNWETVGRLTNDATPTSAQQELAQMLAVMRPQYAPDFDATGAKVQGLQEALTGDLETPLYLLFGASAMLLLAACTNVASSQLARGTARASELAVRSALGASRLRLVRQLLTESGLLALFGAVAGLLLAWALLRLFGTVAPIELHIERVRIDWWVMVFALLVAMVTAILFGLYPAMRLSETNTSLALRQGGRGTESKTGVRSWNILVAAEIALAVTLLAGSGVLIRSFGQVMDVDLGFDPRNVTTAQVELPQSLYPVSTTAIPTFHEAVLGRLRGAAGVEAAGITNRLPLEGANPSGAILVDGKPLTIDGRYNGYAVYRVVGGDYFKALGVRVIEGRSFGPGDDASAPPVTVVDEEFAKTYWPGESAIGHRVRPFGMDRSEEPWYTIVGVIASMRAEAVTAPYRATYYFDHRQRPAGRTQTASYVVRTSLGVASANRLLRGAIWSVDKQVPVENGSMSRIVSQAVADRRFMVLLLGAFAAMALTLALVGIHSVVSYTVAQRTREIGVRLALGATPTQVLQLVLRSAMQGIVPGIVCGIALALITVRTLRTLLYGVSPQDPRALTAAVLLLTIAALVSCLLPARRATRVDPMVAMRAE